MYETSVVMASSVLQLNLQKCSIFNTRSILSIAQNKLFIEPTARHQTATNKSRNLYHTRSLCYLTTKTISKTKQTKVCRKLSCADVYNGIPAIYRTYCTNDNNQQFTKLPTLMEFPEILWPSLLKTIKNWILVNFIIRPYFDSEFTMPSFLDGAKQAVQVVSSALASGQLDSLNGLVTTDALSELKRNVSMMSVSQRAEIAVNKDDIYFSFPYQVGVILDESNESVQKRFVEITVLFHAFRGMKAMKDSGAPPPVNIGERPELSICNYRFIKEFTQGHESDWTVNIVNHYRPIEYP